MQESLKILNFGIIGYGKMGKMYHSILEHSKKNVTFVCDKIKPDIKIDFFYDYKEALGEKNVDGIIIATHAPSHFEIMKNAIDKKIKYIVCEKPFTVSVEQADYIIEKLKNSNTKLVVNYSRRFSNAYINLKNELDKMVIGKIKTIIITSGAGGLAAVGTHYFDICSYLFDATPKSVYAVSVNCNIPNPRGSEFVDPGYLILNFDGKRRAFLDLGDDLGVQPLIEIIGEYGRVKIDIINDTISICKRRDEDIEKPNYLYGLPNIVVKNESLNMGSLPDLIENVVENLLSDEDVLCDAKIAKNNVEVYSAIRESFSTGKAVNFPITGEFYKKEFVIT